MTFEQFWQQLLVAWPYVLFAVPPALFLGKLYGRTWEPDELKKLRVRVKELGFKMANLETEKAKLSSSLKNARGKARILTVELTKHESVREALLGEEDELWRLRDITPPENYFPRLSSSTTRIITVANLKGGVGKTTVASNLCAYLCKKLNKRVLAIDLDYQGSLQRRC